MSEPLARLRAVLEAASSPPWHTDEHPALPLVYAGEPDSIGYDVAELDGTNRDADARAIAALGTLWPELLAVAEAAEDDAIAVDTTQGVNQALRALVAAIDAALPEVTDEGG